MSCGIICKREIDDMPYFERYYWPTAPDLADRILKGFLIFLCLINAPVLIAVALLAEFVL